MKLARTAVAAAAALLAVLATAGAAQAGNPPGSTPTSGQGTSAVETSGGAAAPAAPAAAAPQVQICVPGDFCLNRNGGGTGNGTAVIYWNFNDPNNDFTFLSAGAFVCGLYDRVHNGENGCTGPFTVGSGLNQRYDGHLLFRIVRYGGTDQCTAIPSFGSGLIALGGCSDNGTVFAQGGQSCNPPNGCGNFYASVGESNYQYAHDGNFPNLPFFLRDRNYGAQVGAGTSFGDEAWGCFGHGIGGCP